MQIRKIESSELQRAILEKISKQTTSSVREVERSRLILCMLSGSSNIKIQKDFSISWNKAKRWRDKWLNYEPKLALEEKNAEEKERRYKVEQLLRAFLKDAPRSGSPNKFTAEEFCQILGVSLELPEQSERPISQWSLSELKMEVEKRGIVSSISKAHLGNFLKSERCKAE
jgi:putative transposase